MCGLDCSLDGHTYCCSFSPTKLLSICCNDEEGLDFPQYGVRCTRCCAATVEFMFIALPILISTACSIPPYMQSRYGIAGPWCSCDH